MNIKEATQIVDNPPPIQSLLYPYQREDVEWIIQHPRCIVGSAMGLGK